MAYLELSEKEKEEAKAVLKKVIGSGLPEYLSVSEVSQILNVSPQMVRRYCAEGKIIGKQRLEGSGKWLIPTEQFLSKPEFAKYIKQKEINRLKSMNAAKMMLQMIEDLENGD
ncbi:helix-turn-helix domain-containing protein [Bacillaceae bacterium Marseille-Q3522]|nr:helix-turn-helix domain-containing protein [Bacillaceae bacterium Marseille-Q3522]